MNTLYHNSDRRGLTLVEMMLALSITVMIAGAIASMMAAVSRGVGAKRDTRSVMVRANAAQARLASYLAPSRAVLASDDDMLVVWFNDQRKSNTIHGSEIRWFFFDSNAGAIEVYHVAFPANWGKQQKTTADHEHPSNADWIEVLKEYESQNLIGSVRLVDGISDYIIELDKNAPLDSRIVSFDFDFETHAGFDRVRQTFMLRKHYSPSY